MIKKVYFLIIVLGLVLISKSAIAQQNPTPSLPQTNIISSGNQPAVIPEKLHKKQTQDYEIVNLFAERAFKDVKFSINTSNFSSIDPNFKNVYKTIYNPDELFYWNCYSKKEGLRKFTYDKENGKLEKIVINSSMDYPRISYVYNYPKGDLIAVNIELSNSSYFEFNPGGKYIYIDFSSYMKKLQKRIKKNWNPPKREESKSITIIFIVDKKGDFPYTKILKSSNDQLFDEAAIKAIKDSAPYMPLPDDYNGDNVDIEFKFDYNVHRGISFF
jgi:TonB family protein